MMVQPIPICLFTFNRLEELKKSVNSLSECIGINDFEIHVFSDGPRNEIDEKSVNEVRNFLREQSVIKIHKFYFEKENKGLANSVIEGVTQVINEYNRVIVLEDDLLYAKNFLQFMKQAIEFYEQNDTIYSISGYTPNLKSLQNDNGDFYFCPRASSWGWATWKNRWDSVDWEVKSYNSFKYDLKKRYTFTKGGIDLPRMLDHQMKGKIDSWAIRFVYQQFLNNQYTIYPSKSKIKNIGIGASATHTKKGARFNTSLDSGEQLKFEFKSKVELDKTIMKDFRKVFSIYSRLKDKIYG